MTGSSDLTTEFLKAIYFDGFIEHDIKQNAFDKLEKHDNIAGLQSLSSFQFIFPTIDSNWSWSAEIGGGRFSELSFSRSAFDLAFFGNGQSIGKEYPFEIHYRNFFYQFFQGGIHYHNGRHLAGFAVGPVSGSYLLDMGIHDASIFTATDGSYIDLHGEISMRWSDTTEKHDLWRGTGIALDAWYGMQTKDQRFYVKLDNFGYINFRNNNIKASTDSVWRHEGVQFDIFDNKEVGFTINEDSLKNITGLTRSGDYMLMLPASIELAFEQGFQRHRFMLGIYGKYSLYSLGRPQIHVMPGWRFSSPVKAFMNFSLGGYSGFRTGLHLRAALGRGFGIRLGSHSLAGIWMDNNTAAFDFYITLYKN